jgi:hypothetical protein
VSVGGRPARVLSAKARELRIVVPAAKPGLRRVVVRRGRHRSGKSLRVLKPFTGAVGIKADARRRKTATMGAGGGELKATGADGTSYTLRVPAGALSSDTAITMSPVKAFTGLPFTGGPKAGVVFGPEGLVFATPATLEIASKHAFPQTTTGFSQGGGGFEVAGATVKGRVVTIAIEHFSASGAGAITEADFVNVVGPILNRSGPLSESQLRQIIGLRAEWEALFDTPDRRFCDAQPICAQIDAKGLSSLAALIDSACAAGRAQPAPGFVKRLNELEALRALFNVDDRPSADCQAQIMSSVIGLTAAAARADPRDPSPWFDELGGGFGDIDGDGAGVVWETLLGLAGIANGAGLFDLAGVATAEAFDVLHAMPQDGRTRCAARLTDGVQFLLTGRHWSELVDLDSRQAFNDSLDFCRLTVSIDPTGKALLVGDTFDFKATVGELVDPEVNGGVTWKATRGTIDANGHYTAPAEPGPDQVTATSVLNPDRKATAAVTVNGSFDLQLDVTDEHDPLQSSTVQWNYSVMNTGPETAPSVSLEVTPSTESGLGCSFSQQTIALGDIAAGATVTGSVAYSNCNPGTIHVEMRASAGPGEANPDDNADGESTTVPEGTDPCPIPIECPV